MRRKYRDCQRSDGNCAACSMVSYGIDCHGKQITNLEWNRRNAGMSTAELAAASGVNPRLIQLVENGTSEAGNMAAKNLIALAEALEVDPKELL